MELIHFTVQPLLGPPYDGRPNDDTQGVQANRRQSELVDLGPPTREIWYQL